MIPLVTSIHVSVAATLAEMSNAAYFWRWKWFIFHLIMIPRYLLHISMHRSLEVLSTTFLLCVDQVFGLDSPTMYRTMFAIFAIASVTLDHGATNKKKGERYHSPKTLTITPIPKKYMVLDTFMVHDYYWGLLLKLGVSLGGWLLCIDRISLQTCSTLALNARARRGKVKRRINLLTCSLLAAAANLTPTLALHSPKASAAPHYATAHSDSKHKPAGISKTSDPRMALTNTFDDEAGKHIYPLPYLHSIANEAVQSFRNGEGISEAYPSIGSTPSVKSDYPPMPMIKPDATLATVESSPSTGSMKVVNNLKREEQNAHAKEGSHIIAQLSTNDSMPKDHGGLRPDVDGNISIDSRYGDTHKRTLRDGTEAKRLPPSPISNAITIASITPNQRSRLRHALSGTGPPASRNLCLTTTLEPYDEYGNGAHDYSAHIYSANDIHKTDEFLFNTGEIEFGTDNCATHHICNLRHLFTTMDANSPSIGVRGISGKAMAEGIGTIKFRIIDDKKTAHEITLSGVIYLPEAVKNLISIAKWSEEKNDDCGVLTRGNSSIFFWGHNLYTKTIIHHPSCPIPLMPVQPLSDPFALYLSRYDSQFIDPTEKVNTYLTSARGAPLADKQSSPGDTANTEKQPATLQPGDTVKAIVNGQSQLCTITKTYRLPNNDQRFQVRSLNSAKQFTLGVTDLHTPRPDPADSPPTPLDVGAQTLTQCLSPDDLQTLWSRKADDTVPEIDRLTLAWHHRLRCAPLVTLHRLANRGVIPKRIASVRRMPLCASCIFASAHRRNWRVRGQKQSSIRKPSQTYPGAGTSCDHVVSHQPGLVPQSTGRLTYKRFWGSVVFVDHFSDFVYNHLIHGTTSAETLGAKQAYERVAGHYGVQIKAFHADNSRFDDKAFKTSCLHAGQQLTFCAVGVHHQNGIAENRIKLICNGARTVLLHAMRKWPKVIRTTLWPYAMQAVVDRHNRLALGPDGKSPLEKFANIDDEIDTTAFHTFGCPAFVLEAANQAGLGGTPKWDPRSRTGIYLGRSPSHARNVALILNIQTGLVSPQYHVVFDDSFSTVQYLDSSTPPPNWTKLIASSSDKISDLDATTPSTWFYPHLQPHTTQVSEGAALSSAQQNVSSILRSDKHHTKKVRFHPNLSTLDTSPSSTRTNSPSISEAQQSAREDDTDDVPLLDLETMGLRRSQRLAQRPRQHYYGLLVLALTAVEDISTNIISSSTRCFQQRQAEYQNFLDRNFDGSPNSSGTLAQIFISSKANNEVFTLKEMLLQPDRDKFLEAMEKEVRSMFDEDIIEVVPRRQMLDHYNKVRAKGQSVERQQIMMIWSFKRKRHPDGSLNKHKAQLCCHGGQQQWGLNFWDTYAPVVAWSSIRILLTLAKINKQHTKSVDFIQAYPQAPVKSTIFLRTPPGVELEANKQEDSVMKLKRNLYGLKDAGRTWFQHLSDGLHKMGFRPTESDPCVLTKGTDTIVLYVDDCIIISNNENDAERINQELARHGFKTTDEGTMEEYLGLQFQHHHDGSFRVSQPLLIDRIINTIPGMSDAKGAKSPATTSAILTKDEDGAARVEEWHYRSLIGMLNYLVSCSQPELAFSVHQCARFSQNPKKSHEQAVKRIIRYLVGCKRNKEQGMIFQPDKNKSIDTFVDASFAGEWNSAWSDEPSSVMSRTGYVIMFANCAIIWSSKLQTEITLSTTESEYVALSQSLRDVIPLMALLRELKRTTQFEPTIPTIHCTVHEDNQGCIDLVETPRMRPRTKHIALKYHHFRKHVKDGTVNVKYVETDRQIADIFTKALSDAKFVTLRRMMMGW